MSPAMPLFATSGSPLTLQLRPSAAAEYRAVQKWKTFLAGKQQLLTVTKQLGLGIRAWGDRYELHFATTAPQLIRQGDLQPLEQLALRLAALYESVVVEASPTGQFLAVLNHEQLLSTWQTLRSGLLATTTDDDALTVFLVEFLDRQLPDPANVLQSLRQDYVYQTLVHDIYAQPLMAGCAEGRIREFPRFFPQQSLHFFEHCTEIERTVAGRVQLSFRGVLDVARTDVAGIGQVMAAALQPPDEQRAGSLPTPPDAPLTVPHFSYTATYELDLATGLPLTVVLDVYARLAEVYNKQCTLTLDRI